MKRKFIVNGMSCSACSLSVEKAVRRLDGVKKADVSLVSKTLFCDYDASKTDESAIIAAVERAGFEAETVGTERKAKKDDAENAVKVRLWSSVVFLAVLMYFSMGHMLSLPLTHWLAMPENAGAAALIQLLLTLPVVFINRKFFISGTRAAFNGSPDMDTLVALGSGSALVYGVVTLFSIVLSLDSGDLSGASDGVSNLYFESCAMILTLVTVGKYLEERSKGKTDEALKKLASMVPETVVILDGETEKTIDAKDLKKDDILIVRAGERLSADGVIVFGSSAIDEAAITGESLPADKTVGDSVISGSMILDGAVHVRAERVGSETTLSRMITLVEEAAASKAPIARIADRVSGVFVPTVLILAAVTAAVWLLIGRPVPFAFNMAVSVLVISCPCALGLATPVALTVAMGRCAASGVLVKDAKTIEMIGKTTIAALDKTGTVTDGVMSVTEIVPYGCDAKTLLSLAASVESLSSHPLAKAVTAHYDGKLLPVTDFRSVFGRGVEAVVEGVSNIKGGNREFMNESGVNITPLLEKGELIAQGGATPLYFSNGNEVIGIIAVADTVKETSAQSVRSLREMGIRTVMITGDNSSTAAAVASAVGVEEVHAGVLPEQKSEIIDALRRTGTVLMVGDGVNDSPSLSRADVGVAVAQGSDIAVDAADVVLMNGDLAVLPRLIAYGKRVMRNVKENLFWAFFYNAVCIPLAAGVFSGFGIMLNPMIAALCMSLSSLFVVTNALRLRKTSKGRNTL